MRVIVMLCQRALLIGCLVFIQNAGLAQTPTTDVEPAEMFEETETSQSGTITEADPVALAPDNNDAQIALDGVSVELEHRFNDLRREFLDLEIGAVHRWLTVMAIILTVMGLLVPVAGYLGFRRFREIERDARQTLEKIKDHEQEAMHRVESMPKVTAQDAEADEEVLDKVRAATQDSGVGIVDLAVAEALALQKNGQIKEAIAKWKAIANLVADKDKNQAARAHFSVGYLYMTSFSAISVSEEKALDRAITSYDEAVRLDPDNAKAYNNRGIAKGKMGRKEEAIADFDKAVRLDPDYVDAHFNRGVVKGEVGRHKEAIADYNEAVRLDPDDAKAYNNRGISKMEMGRHEEAIADFDEAVRLDPDHAKAYNNRGVAKKEMGRHEEANSDFDEAVRLDPGLGPAESK